MTFVKFHPEANQCGTRGTRRRRQARRRNPLLNNIINELMNSSIPEIINPEVKTDRPMVNIIEAEDSFSIEMALPGLSKKDINIEVEKETLSISAALEAKPREGETLKRKEFDFSNFKRSFKLPKIVDATNIKATFKHGILVLNIAKNEEAKELPPRKIAIK